MTNAKDVMKSWGWRVRRLNMTQTEFAEHIGMTGPKINQYINGKVDPAASRYMQIENALLKMEQEKGLEV